MIGLYVILGFSGFGGLDILDARVDRLGNLFVPDNATVPCVGACEPGSPITASDLRRWTLVDSNLATLPMPEWLHGKVRHYLHKNYCT